MNNISSISDCTGCGVCSNICPTKAIKMQRDKFGFLYPYIDETLCVNCGECIKYCHTTTEIKPQVWKGVYCGWHKDDYVRKNSSSGGAFSAFAESVLQDNGVVFAHTFCSEDKYVKCVKIEKKEDIAKTRTSKYVESSINDIISEIGELLKKNIKVMFVGTPCHVAAIKKVFESFGNLITVSFLCHGVSGPEMFKTYLSELEAKNGKVKHINFRDKTIGWHDQSLSVVFESGKKRLRHYSVDPYSFMYSCTDKIMRDSCYRCRYHSGHNGDIIIGDYSNIAYNPQIYDDPKGISQIIVNNERGFHLLQNTKSRMELIQLSDEACKNLFFDAANNNISKKIEEREKFYILVQQKGFIKAVKILAKKKRWLLLIKSEIKRIYRFLKPIKWR